MLRRASCFVLLTMLLVLLLLLFWFYLHVLACPDEFYGESCLCFIPSENVTTDNPLLLLTKDMVPVPTSYSEMTNDQLKIVFRESLKYTRISYNLKQECGQNSPASSPWSWTVVDYDYPNCYREVIGLMPWTDELVSGCGFERKLEGDTIVYQVDFSVTTEETLDPLRHTVTSRLIEHLMPFTIRFPTRVQADASLTVFSALRPLFAISRQDVEAYVDGSVDPDDTVLYLEWFSSIQYPFVLDDAPTLPDGLPTNVEILSAPTLKQGTTICDDPGSDGNLQPACTNYWTLAVKPARGSGLCEFDGSYKLQWGMSCQPSASDACPLHSGNSAATVVLQLDTAPYCSSLVDQIDFSITFAAYADAGFQTLKSNFLDSQIAHFRASIAAPGVTIESTSWKRITFERQGQADVQLLTLDGLGANSVAGNSYELVTTDGGASSSDGTTKSNPNFRLRIKTGENYLAVPVDGSAAVGVSGELTVSYAAGSFSQKRPPAERRIRRLVVKPALPMADASKEQDTQTPTVPLEIAEDDSGSSSEDSTILGFEPMFVYGAGGFMVLAILVMAVVVAVRRRNSSRKKNSKKKKKRKDTLTSEDKASIERRNSTIPKSSSLTSMVQLTRSSSQRSVVDDEEVAADFAHPTHPKTQPRHHRSMSLRSSSSAHFPMSPSVSQNIHEGSALPASMVSPGQHQRKKKNLCRTHNNQSGTLDAVNLNKCGEVIV